MRLRMSKSYTDELRGSNQQNVNPPSEEISHTSLGTNNTVKPTVSSLSLPQVRFHTKLTSSSKSAITLRDHIKVNPVNKSILVTTHTDDDNEKEEVSTCKTVIRNNNQLTVPPTGDYCIRISNVSSTSDEQPEIVFNDSRLSDALGYLRMYKSQNRIQYNALQFNDREDLQVNRN